MFDFGHHMKKALAKRRLGRAMIGTLALKAVKNFYDKKKIPTGEIDWFVKHDKIFLRTNNQAFKIQLYRDQFELLKFVNEYLEDIGYQIKMKKVLFGR